MSLNSCMLIFSCLEAETRRLQALTPGSTDQSVWTKMKFMWNQDRLKELLNTLRGQQTSISFLLQVLECRTLSDIQRDVQANKAKIRASAADAQSVSSRNSSVKTGRQSVFDNDTHRLSMFAEDLISVAAAPSELDFEFDDFMINSQAYRRVFAKAQAQDSQEVHVQNMADDLIDLSEALVDSSDAMTIRDMNQELVTLDIDIQRQASVSSVPNTQKHIPSAASIPRKPLASPSVASPDRTLVPMIKAQKNLKICSKCGEGLSGQYVKAFETNWHLECFTCQDCGRITADKFFSNPDNPNVPLCMTDYFRRLDLICENCGGCLRGDYITAAGRKFHLEHFRCTDCDIDFGEEENFYEHESQVLCLHDYCRAFASRCTGCTWPITGEYTESADNMFSGMWHPACYQLSRHLEVTLKTTKLAERLLKSLQQKYDGDTALQVYDEKHAAMSARIWVETSSFIEAVTGQVTRLQEDLSPNDTKHCAFTHWNIIVSLLDALWQAEVKVAGIIEDAYIQIYAELLDPSGEEFALHLAKGIDLDNQISKAITFMLRRTLIKVLDDDEWCEPNSRLNDFLSHLETSRQIDHPLLGYPADKPTRREFETLLCTTCSKPITKLAFSDARGAWKPGERKWHPRCWSCPSCGAGPKKQQIPLNLHERIEYRIFWYRMPQAKSDTARIEP